MIKNLWLAFSLIIGLSLSLSLSLNPSAASASAQEKRIAITFDDVPRSRGHFFTSDERARQLIINLRKAGVSQAAFFVNPGKIAERPGAQARIAAYVEAGHVIANHTNTHPRLSQTETSDFIADVESAQNWLAGRPGMRPWFRFSYLDEGQSDKTKRDALRAALRERGLLNASPTVDASDWWLDSALANAERERLAYNPPAARDLFVQTHVEAAEFYHELALETFERPISHNILLHETDLAMLFIGDLVEALREAGWTIITADEAFADPTFQSAPDVPSAQGTLVELAAWAKGIDPPRWYRGNDTRLLKQWFDAQVLGLDDEEATEK